MKLIIHLIAATALLFSACASISSAKASYNVVVIGDVHFDGPETNTYHDCTAKWSPNKRKEFKRNVAMWDKLMPALLDSAGLAARNEKALFAIQLGDIVQGDCPDKATHGKMVSDAFSTLKARFPEIPLLPTMGNHDFRSPNGRNAYLETMTPLLSNELGRNVKAPNYVVRQGPDVFIFADFNLPDVAFLKKALEDSEGARHVFVVSHGLLVPDNDSDWFLLGRGTKPEVREEMRKLFAKHDVIGISGHVHRTEFIKMQFDEGTISQLVVSSVRANASSDSIDPPFGEAPEDYGLGKYRNGKFPAIMEPYAPKVKSYFSTKAAGYVVLKISDTAIKAEFHPGDSPKPEKTFLVK